MPTLWNKYRPAGTKPYEQKRREFDQQRGTPAERGYDAAWRKLRIAFLRQHPTCCEEGCEKPATDVDHIKSIRERPDLRLVWSNLRAMCHSHHSARTSREQSWNTR